jgi:hypothetical protein
MPKQTTRKAKPPAAAPAPEPPPAPQEEDVTAASKPDDVPIHPADFDGDVEDDVEGRARRRAAKYHARRGCPPPRPRR